MPMAEIYDLPIQFASLAHMLIHSTTPLSALPCSAPVFKKKSPKTKTANSYSSPAGCQLLSIVVLVWGVSRWVCWWESASLLAGWRLCEGFLHHTVTHICSCTESCCMTCAHQINAPYVLAAVIKVWSQDCKNPFNMRQLSSQLW